MAELLTHHVTLKDLYLDSCYIGNHGVKRLGDALESNRSLEKMSLSRNRFDKEGITVFMDHVKLNGKLSSLTLSYNNIGAEGVRACGNCLLLNDSLRVLDLSHTNALSGNSGMGLHAIGTALRTKNKGLQELYMVGNRLTNEVIVEFAYSLTFNRGLRVCDMRANNLDGHWFEPDTYIPTKLIDEMPSIRTTMDRNIRLHQDPTLTAKFSVKPRPMEDEVEGRWTVRRRWRKLNKQGERERLEAIANAEEQERIDLEEDFIRERVSEEMHLLDKFLISSEGVTFCKHLAKVIAQYIHALAMGTEAQLIARLENAEKSRLVAVEQQRMLQEKKSEAEKKPVLSNIVARKAEEQRLKKQAEDDSIAQKKLEKALEETALATRQHTELSNNWVSKSHLAIITCIFILQECDENYFLEPQKIDRVFNALCLPLREADAVRALNETVLIGKNMIGIKKMTKFIKGNSYNVSLTNKLKRFQLLADLIVRAPIEEAKTILRTFHKAEETRRLLKEYRGMNGKEPKFLCQFCYKRFVSAKMLARHNRKLSQHQRYLQKEDIMASMQYVLRRAKFFMTGTYFPAFYELVPHERLPAGHLPQIFDSHGMEGRPIGVLEESRSVRVEDSLGYWVKIRWEGGHGWMLFRTKFTDILVPALSSISKSFWVSATVWERPNYYRVSEDLPDNVEIKVRWLPVLTGPGSDVLGYLTKGQIVECGE